MENPVFNELLVALPDWSARLKVLSARYPETFTPQPSRKRAPSLSICEDEPVKPCAKVTPAAEGSQAVTTVVGPHPLRQTPAAAAAAAAAAEEKEKLQQRKETEPTPPKAKFSAINGPQIYYDGEAQKALFDCWTTLNAKRGQLRKEMMGIRRKKMMSLPITDYGYSDESDEEDGESEKKKETPEEKQARLEEEKRKAEEERIRLEREKKAAEVLEYIDSCLDKAAKGCENAAFLWLKGEACSGHVNFIVGRMQDAVERIKAEIAKAAEPKPEPVEKIEPDEGLGDDDEGLGDDVYMEDAGQPQTIKVDSRPEHRIARPIRRAGGFMA
ncbi:uncharacterized protein LAJ45_00764 [Morchella importuna]|uniref:uncharacterized protein n=1 Tax=Morchella importuna TaxID=1174673 RepID=UPI001E8D02F3|nr:uncharacterized protein LAJ45_00764 [Morchella importuna]KAH8155754.1 hypothetical protein LAJ45_00764 [Morchella importuna]